MQSVHSAFKDLVLERRPSVNITKVGEGGVYLGAEAKKLGLCDGVAEVEGYVDKLLSKGVDVIFMTEKPEDQKVNGFLDIASRSWAKVKTVSRHLSSTLEQYINL